jgi:signal transduction histidine kinase
MVGTSPAGRLAFSQSLDLDETASIVRESMDVASVTICGWGAETSDRLSILGASGEDLTSFGVDPTDPAPLRHPWESLDGAPAVIRRSADATTTLMTLMAVEDHPVGLMHAVVRGRQVDPTKPRLLAYFARQVAFAMEHNERPAQPTALVSEFDALSALDEIALVVSDYGEFVQRLTEVLAPLVDAELVAISVVDEQRGVLQMLPASYGASPEVAASSQTDLRDSRSSSARVLRMRQPWMTEHADSEPGALQEFVRAFGLRRVITIPLITGGRSIGILNLANKPTPFTPADIARIQLFAPRVASAVENVRLLLRIRRREALEAILTDLAVSIAQRGSGGGRLTDALAAYAEVTGAGLAVLSPSDGEQTVVRRAAVPHDLETTFFEDSREVGSTTRAALAAPRAAGDPGSAALHVPILVSKQRVAAVSVLRRGGGPFGSDESAALSRFADLAALAWTTERYQHQRARTARLAERQRIAADLHDRVAQMLFSGQLALEAVLERDEIGSTSRADVTRARSLFARGQVSIREVIDELSEPQRADLATRLTVLGEELEAEHRLAVDVDVDSSVAEARPIRKAIADLFARTAGEAVTNTSKHARRATRITISVRITRDHRLLMTAVDDGEGPSGRSSGSRHGLVSLRNAFRIHGGTVRVGRDPATGGMRLTASVPL